MEQINKHIEVYTEANPNPGSLKFVVNFLITPDDSSYDFESKNSTGNSPLAKQLFDFDFVHRVFIMNNFITITKDENTEWNEVIPKIKKSIKNYLEEGKEVIVKESNSSRNEIKENDPEEVKKIKGVLDEYIRPAIAMDGGAIEFESYVDGVVKVQLHGSCNGCPSATLTLKSAVENMLKRFIPEVEEVIAEGV